MVNLPLGQVPGRGSGAAPAASSDTAAEHREWSQWCAVTGGTGGLEAAWQTHLQTQPNCMLSFCVTGENGTQTNKMCWEGMALTFEQHVLGSCALWLHGLCETLNLCPQLGLPRETHKPDTGKGHSFICLWNVGIYYILYFMAHMWIYVIITKLWGHWY